MADPSRTRALAILCLTQFMLVLDVNIVNVALPSIAARWQLREQDLQWVVSAYVLCFGGFQLLAGRIGDLLGRRAVFLAGASLFTAGSALCGLAPHPAVLVAARALQGLGAAAASPTALSIITGIYQHDGADRRTALGLWSAAAPAGGVAGLLLGGLLTQALGWRAVFLVNLPIGMGLLVAAITTVPTVAPVRRRARPDVAGAITITGGLVLTFWGLSQAQDHGWGAATALLGVFPGIAMIAGFALIERRVPDPLVPPSVFGSRRLTTATFAAATLTATTSPMGFFLSLHLQQVKGYSPGHTGLAYLPVLASVATGSVLGPRLIGRVGATPVMTGGLASIASGTFVLFLTLSENSAYATSFLPAGILYGLGLGLGSVASTTFGTLDAPPTTQGLVSGILNAAAPLGTATGLAILVGIAASRTHPNTTTPTASLEHGFHWAFAAATITAALAAMIIPILARNSTIGGRDQQIPEA